MDVQPVRERLVGRCRRVAVVCLAVMTLGLAAPNVANAWWDFYWCCEMWIDPWTQASSSWQLYAGDNVVYWENVFGAAPMYATFCQPEIRCYEAVISDSGYIHDDRGVYFGYAACGYFYADWPAFLYYCFATG